MTVLFVDCWTLTDETNNEQWPTFPSVICHLSSVVHKHEPSFQSPERCHAKRDSLAAERRRQNCRRNCRPVFHFQAEHLASPGFVEAGRFGGSGEAGAIY